MRAHGLTGWVRNRRDGAVETVIHGDAADVAEMIALCWQGPPDARVENVEIVQEGGAAPGDFNVLPTA